LQSGAEATEFIPLGSGRGRLYVAMTNFTLASLGLLRYPGTVQIFDVEIASPSPVRARSVGPHATETILLGGYNPVALRRLTPTATTTPMRLLITVAGASTYDANFNLIPATDASVEAYRADTAEYLGSFRLGLTSLSATRAAIGTDEAGHHVGYFPSAVTGEVYLLLLDGLFTPTLDPLGLAVLRGPHNGIPITAAQAGGPGGNITGVGLSPDGRTLVVSGFGDLFASPTALPGRLYLLGLPEDVVAGADFGADFVPGSTLYGTVPGRALGALALSPNPGSRPDVYLAVSGPLDLVNFLGTGPASVGTLQTFGLIR
ncbi:MAG: hypothetical protein ACYTG6_16720, partial [Planctomycetota bacterium]